MKNDNGAEICEVKRCKRPSDVVYAASYSKRSRKICNHHWGRHCKGIINLKSKGTYKKNNKNSNK